MITNERGPAPDEGDPASDAPPPPTVRFEIARRSLVWIGAALFGCWLLVQLWTVILVVIVALFIAATLAPVVKWLERHRIPRGWALVLVFVGMIAALGALLLLTLPPLIDELLRILDDAPHVRARLIAWLEQYQSTAQIAKSIKAVPLDHLFSQATTSLLGYSSQLLTLIGYGLTTLFLAFYLLIDAKQAHGALYALVPRRYHLRLARILLNFETIVGGYIRGQIITSLAITGFTFGLLTLFGVRDALALAIFAGLTDVIPFIGGILATVPCVLVTLGQGVGTALAVLGIMVVYQEFESRILVPRIYGRVLRLPASVVLIALMIGGTLLGIIGALIALPIASGALMIVRELRFELPGDDRDDSRQRARDERAEKVYEHLSAGAPAQEAAVIATELAQRIKQREAQTGAASRADTVETPVVAMEKTVLAPEPDAGSPDEPAKE